MSHLAGFATTPAAAQLDLTVRTGLIDWASDKTAEIQPVLQALAVTVAIIFVVYKAVQSKLSLGTMIASALAAAILIWLSLNITELTDILDEDLPGGDGGDGVSDVVTPGAETPTSDGDPAGGGGAP